VKETKDLPTLMGALRYAPMVCFQGKYYLAQNSRSISYMLYSVDGRYSRIDN
jgi:hypothetical protein